MIVGKYTVRTINAGSLWLDGGAIFGIVPKTIWSKYHTPDERNRILCVTRCLLIQGNGRLILVDTGSGTKWNEKQKAIYTIEHSLKNSLEQLGFHPEDVTDVLLTHLHFDHAGGATEEHDGVVQSVFPRATYYVQQQHWNWALHPTEKDRGSFRPQDFLPLQEYNQLKLLDGETTIADGISVIVTTGHTVAQQLVKISDGTTTVLYCGDFLPYAALIPFPYIMAYDLFPLETLNEKKRLLQQAADEKWLLVLEHDPSIEAITVRQTEKGFEPATFLSL